MKRKIILSLLALLVVAIGLSFISNTSNAKMSPPSTAVKWDYSFGKVPLYFIPNKGQVDAEAKFYAVTSRYTLWMTKGGLVFDSAKNSSSSSESSKPDRDVSSLIFLDSREDFGIEPVDNTSSRVNYYIGDQPSEWKIDIHPSKGVLYRNLYNNIDLKVYGVENQIEYDWVIKPGGNSGDIRFEYKNIKSTLIDSHGDIIVETGFGKLIHKKPVSFQLIDGKRVDIESKFVKNKENGYGFSLGTFDKKYDVIIDPVVSVAFSTYLGGNDEEGCFGIKVDEEGCVYITGNTFSLDFPTANAYQPQYAGPGDMFILKLSADGSTLIYSTYLGGTGNDVGKALALTPNHSVCISGSTDSNDFPAQGQAGGSMDAIVVILDPNGDLKYARYLGGSLYDASWAVAADTLGNVFVAGHTFSADFPTVKPYQSHLSGEGVIPATTDVFVSIVNPDSGLIYSTYLGGSGNDGAQGIEVDGSGAFVVVGYTRSLNFPTKNALQSYHAGGTHDGFITKFSANGSQLVYSTYLGGADFDNIWGLTINTSGNVYVTGSTSSLNFPVKNAYQKSFAGGDYDVFFSKLSTDGKSLVFSSFLGGTLSDSFADIEIDNTGNIYLFLDTESSDIPIRNAYQSTFGGYSDTYISKFNPDASNLIYATYFGGSGEDHRGNLAVDDSGNVYLSGKTTSTNFPLQNPFQNVHGGGLTDAFAVKLAYTYDLTIYSAPDSNIPISVMPIDNNANMNGNTLFKRNYNPGQIVMLTAPASFNGRNFYKWSVDGVDTFNVSASVTMNRNHIAVATYWNPPLIVLNHSKLFFGCLLNGSAPGSQTLTIRNSTGGTLDWSISSNVSWLLCSPTSGQNSGVVDVSVNTAGLTAGTYNGLILVSDPNAVNSPQTVPVTLKIYTSSAVTENPFGSFDTPLEGAVVNGSIPVTGWALDDLEVASVKIYRKDGDNLLYTGDAVFVEGARPDVEQSFPGYPKNYQAGWGYMMLTKFLPNGGNGTFTFMVIAEDKEGNKVILGTRTITCDNSHSVKPFGAIDTPTQGGVVSGNSVVNFGWALTPMPNYIPFDGSTIHVWIDGVDVGKPVYSIFRGDIASMFPDYLNRNGAIGYFYFDTTKYSNGVHIIYWTVTDSAGNSDGIGSRYFSILNANAQSAAIADNAIGLTIDSDTSHIPLDKIHPVKTRTGYKKNDASRNVFPDNKGELNISICELERVEIHFSKSASAISTLPVGSMMDSKHGIFYWQPGPGFLGKYRLQFAEPDQTGKMWKRFVTIKILPRH